MALVEPTLQELYKGFFIGFRRRDRYLYMDKIRSMPALNLKSIIIEFDDLLTYDQELAKDLIENPKEHLKSASDALRELLKEVDEEFVSRTAVFYVRFKGLPNTLIVPIRKLRAEHIGKLVSVEGIATKISRVRFKLGMAYLKCPECGAEYKISTEEEETIKTRMKCGECGYEGRMRLLEEKSLFIDFQRMFVQEKPEELSMGEMPRGIEVELEGDLVDSVKPGDRLIVTGIVELTRERGLPHHYGLKIYANYIETKAKELVGEFTEEDEKEIKSLANDPRIVDKIISSIAPSIYGMREYKEAIALQLFGGVPKILPDGIKVRGDINVLFVGDPGTAKTQLLRYAAQISPRGIYTTGKGTTAAGLTAAVVRDKVTGDFYLEAGALVLADGGLACIDEIDKMRSEDRVAMHEAMEHQSVSISKAGIYAVLNARAAVLAAANPKFGKYDQTKSIVENINLPPTILSRFDLIFHIVDEPDPEKDKELSRHILSMHMMHDRPMREIISPNLLKKYIAYARKYVRPKLTEEAVKIIEDFFVKLRSKASKTSSRIPITARQLEALIRMSEARARMRLSDVVTAEDAQAAVNLMKFVLERVLIDTATGETDVTMLHTGVPSSKIEKMKKLISIIRELGGKEVEVEIILEKAENSGISRDEAEELIKKLKDEGSLYEPSVGRVSLA